MESSTTPGPCPTCGEPLVRQTDRRKEQGFSLRCSVGGHSRPGGGPGGTRLKKRSRRAGTPTSRRPAKAPTVASQRWMTDPSVPCCSADDCFVDAAACERHRKT